MKRKITKGLKAFIACIILVLSMTAITASAEEVLEETSVIEDGETGESENFFERVFETAEKFSSEILCALSFTCSLILTFSYKKGLLPTVKSGIGTIGSVVGSMKEHTESYAKHQEEMITIFSERLARAEEMLARFERSIDEIAAKTEDGSLAANDRASMKALMSAQIDMLYDIFMSSSLPQYQKETVSERLRGMKEVTAGEKEAE